MGTPNLWKLSSSVAEPLPHRGRWFCPTRGVVLRLSEEGCVEAHVPAEQSSSCPQARLSQPHEHCRRTRRAEGAPCQGPPQALGLIWHILERSVFARLSRDGVRTRAGVLWCTFLLDPSQDPPRVGFAISRAVGPAVVRNQLRRRLRVLLSAAALPPGNYLVGTRPAAAGRSSVDLRRDVQALSSGVRRSLPTPPSTNTRSPIGPASSSDSC